MRVLFLRRDPSPELRRWTDELARTVSRKGFTARVVDADEWMPRQTDPALNNGTKADLKDVAEGFDFVHAFGYRTAWACAEAFGDREVWLYTAYDRPKTTNPKLIERLNQAQLALCVSRYVSDGLESAEAANLDILNPGVDEDLELMRERSAVREELGVPEDVFLIGVDEATPASLEAVRDRDLALLALSGEREESWPANAMAVPARDRRELMRACDLWLCTDRTAGFSMSALDAMALSMPVLAPHGGVYREIVAEDVTGQLYFEDQFLGDTLAVLADMSLTLEAYGQAARVRLEERFTIDRCAQRLADLYGQWVQ